MSSYPATLGDLADVEAALRARLERLEKRLATETEITDEKVASMREQMDAHRTWIDAASIALHGYELRIQELDRLWRVALENPDLVRELAAVGAERAANRLSARPG
jgi:hypothetical protein